MATSRSSLHVASQGLEAAHGGFEILRVGVDGVFAAGVLPMVTSPCLIAASASV